jgi:hypothetical protein
MAPGRKAGKGGAHLNSCQGGLRPHRPRQRADFTEEVGPLGSWLVICLRL